MSKPHIEIERRGPLNAKQWDELATYANAHGKLQHDQDELTLYIESPLQYDTISTNKSGLLSASVKIAKDRMGQETTMIYREKTGSIDQTLRAESSMPHSFSRAADIIPYLQSKGFTDACPRYFHRMDFVLQLFVISMKEGGYIEDHFEIEIADVAAHVSEREKDLIQQFVDERHLRLYSAAEGLTLLAETYRAHPPIPIVSHEMRDLLERCE